MGETLPVGEGIEQGRDAFDRQAWGSAYEHLSTAALEEPLEVDDLERLAAAAYLAGLGEESSKLWAQASQECARIGEVARAARCAFWLAFALLNGGELARGGGWIDRAQRLLDQRRLDCVEQGYLRYGAALRAVFSGELAAALAGFHEAAGMGERFQDVELTTLARISEGRCLIYSGDVAGGVALCDEAMVAVEANEVSAIATGDAYCTVIEGCRELFDVARAREWTAALSRWCDAQPELVLYRGQMPGAPGRDPSTARRLGRGARRNRPRPRPPGQAHVAANPWLGCVHASGDPSAERQPRRGRRRLSRSSRTRSPTTARALAPPPGTGTNRCGGGRDPPSRAGG